METVREVWWTMEKGDEDGDGDGLHGWLRAKVSVPRHIWDAASIQSAWLARGWCMAFACSFRVVSPQSGISWLRAAMSLGWRATCKPRRSTSCTQGIRGLVS